MIARLNKLLVERFAHPTFAHVVRRRRIKLFALRKDVKINDSIDFYGLDVAANTETG